MIADDIQDWVRMNLWYQVPVSISVIDRDFRIVEANPDFAKNFGDWRDRPCYAVYKGRAEHCENCAADLTFADGLVRVREEQGLRLDGKRRDYLIHMVPLIDHDGRIPLIVEMSTDITAAKRLEKEKLEAERLATVGQTVAGLAHGIKNLLMGIDGGMYVVRSGMERGDADRIFKGWRMLEKDIARITAVVKEFLDFAKGRPAKVREVDPNEPARRVIALFREDARRKGIEIRARLQEPMDTAFLDGEGIQDCLVNLVSNALDACEISDKPNRNVVLSSRDIGGSIVYEVADDGVGMDYDVKKRVFTNFFTTKESGRGTGLGLLTTRKIVQEHGGKLSFESAEGAGSIFRLELPRDRLPGPAGDGERGEAVPG